MTSEHYLTTSEAATRLGVSVRTVQLWVEAGRLDAWRTQGGHRRILSASVDRLVSARDPEPPAPRFNALSVLVVEDDASLVKLYRMRMASWSFPVRVSSAANAFDGLVLIGEMAPHLLVMDLRLPGINGFQMVRALGNIPRYEGMEIVAVSGMSNQEIDAHGGLPPHVSRLGKPIDFTRLEAIAADCWNAVCGNGMPRRRSAEAGRAGEAAGVRS